MKNIWILLLFTLVTGCGTLGGDKAADNREWIPIACIGSADWQDCHAQARKYCGDNYDVRNQQENLVTQNRRMQVACKG